MSARIGSLFSGTGGLDMGVQAALGGEVVWNVEYDEAPSKILEHHWPGVPNYGDVTTVDWASVPEIDTLTAGYPCQPFSQAGKRKGSTDERHLWPYALDAIRQLRPRLVVLENVRGHLTLGFDRVLGDLAEAGYDTEWICLPASAAGAPHRRERIFIVAHPAGEPWSERDGDDVSARSNENGYGPATGRGSAPDTDHLGRDGRPEESQRRSLLAATTRDRAVATHPDDEGRRSIGRVEREQRDPDGRSSADPIWGAYEPAIRRWESVTGRLAPAPTRPDGRADGERLSADFVEWMMGLPAGHVTGAGITRAEQLKALGNGVVPQQAALALSLLIRTSHRASKGDAS